MHLPYIFRKKKKSAEDAETTAMAENSAPEVSTERFFEVKGSLKEVFEQKSQDAPFSLMSLFKGGGDVEKTGIRQQSNGNDTQ